jgi:hypothetical protein
MPSPANDTTAAAILAALQDRPDGLSFSEIYAALTDPAPTRTVQYWLRAMVDDGRLNSTGRGRWVRYHVDDTTASAKRVRLEKAAIPLSDKAKVAQTYIRQAQILRKPAGYDRNFLETYRPNTSSYLSAAEQGHLATVGEQGVEADPGTYARQILNRLLIDLSWNSSRLEGNTYSLGDTERLIAYGQAADGLPAQQTQMILNHKAAIEFLVNSADEIELNGRTIQNLHGLLADNLLNDPSAEGRLRFIGVGIGGCVFHPLEGPQLIRECFDQVLATAVAIRDPFEQALFLMVQLPYLQPFDDVNKRVSRLAANIPFIKRNLSPLSFTDVPADLYREAILAVYELKDVSLLKDVFIWAYERSADRYRATRQSLGEPDPLKLKYRGQLRDIVARIIRGKVDRGSALLLVQDLARTEIAEADREAFTRMAQAELISLHEGNFARYSVRPSEFDAWQLIWNPA